ncbi:HmuY family protein [Hyunsoonleella ulvae]|uniref:HmuY family protein n=1 Tax=Hyunsoonleella ulvae TaxID=2799948 RepID=UPI00193A5202|nr:HmuY family protein [Hyunsoonleella ulvae]
MKTNLIFIKALVILFLVSACSNDDDEAVLQDFAVAFENPSASFLATDADKDVVIVFAPAATSNGIVTINYTLDNAEYGLDGDFTTVPVGDGGTIALPFTAGAESVSFKVNKLKTPIEGDTKAITFSISQVSLSNATVSGNVDFLLSFTETAALGGVIAPEVGGVNYTNQVFIDLSAQTTNPVRRDAWELAFHSGAANKVFLNSALRVTAAELSDFTDLSAVTSATAFSPALEIDVYNLFTQQTETKIINSVEEYKEGVKQSYSMYGPYADHIDGSATAISEISTTPDDNKVYLVYMGSEIPTTAGSGSTNHSGDDRGWYKVRITMDGEDYKLQYAELESTTIKETTIAKNADYNTVAFSLKDEKLVTPEPKKDKWDINFAGVFGAENGPTYSDYVIHNTLGGTGLYKVSTKDSEGVAIEGVPTFEDFSISDVDNASLNFNERNIIGSGWRDPFAGPVAVVKDDRYFVIKDTAGNYYKLRFNAVVNENGERGNPKFEYELLQ